MIGLDQVLAVIAEQGHQQRIVRKRKRAFNTDALKRPIKTSQTEAFESPLNGCAGQVIDAVAVNTRRSALNEMAQAP